MSSQVKGRARRKRRKAQPSEGHVPSVLLSPEQFRGTAPSPATRKCLPCGCSVGHNRCSGDLDVMAGTEPHDKGACSLVLAWKAGQMGGCGAIQVCTEKTSSSGCQVPGKFLLAITLLWIKGLGLTKIPLGNRIY